MRLFRLEREEDPTGVSGIGVVAEGVAFTDGTCALRWLTTYRSTAIYNSVEDLREIHLHHGMTELVWIDASTS